MLVDYPHVSIKRRHAILSSRAHDHYGNIVRRDIPLHYFPDFEQMSY